MKRWIAGMIGGLALAGIVITGIVFGASYVFAQTDAASRPAPGTWSPAPPPPTPTPSATAAAGTVAVADGAPVAIDPTLPSADNPWPEGVMIPDDLNARIGAAETALITPCMAAQGFTYQAPAPSNKSMWPPGLTDDEKALAPAQAIKLIGSITASPNWVRHDREEGAHIAGAAVRTMFGAARRVPPSLRSELRLATRRRVVLQPQDVWESTASFAVHLEDLSFGGCRVRSPRRLASGDRYLVHFANQTPESSTAEVLWVRRRGGRYVAGLKFGSSSERLALP